MTIQELYDWTKENNCLDIKLAKNCNLDIFDIETVVAVITSNDAALFGIDGNKVILD